MAVESIYTEAQLLAAVEAERWCDSDGESCCDDDDTDFEPTGDTLGLHADKGQPGPDERTDWYHVLWNTKDSLNNASCSLSQTTSRSVIDIEAILGILFPGSDSTDFGGHVSSSSTEPLSPRGEDDDVSDEMEDQSSSSGDPKVVANGGVLRGVESLESEEVVKRKKEKPSGSDTTPTEPVSPGPIVPDIFERPKHYYIAHELMTTERTYVQNLRLLEKVVIGAVRTANLTRRTILPDQGRKEIFLNIGEIYALNFDLLQELEERIENWDANPKIADVLAKRVPFFKLYSMYSSKFDSAQVAYCKWLKTSKAFANLIKLIETSPLCKGLPVSSYMLCPVQRIPRYRLLLQDYLKHLPDGHADIPNTQAALAAISEAADYMNDRISDMENQAKVVQMQKTFVGRDNYVAPGRKYLGRGPVYFVPGSQMKQRVLFLFSDILLITRIYSHGRYKVNKKMFLKDMLVSVVQSPILPNAFCVAERGLTRALRFSTKSLEERNQWIVELNHAKAKENGVFETLSKNSPHAAVLNDPEAYSSILAVLNDPSFEHSQPSWVRRTLHATSISRMGIPFTSYALAAAHSASGEGSSGARDTSDTEEIDFNEEVVMEFETDEEMKEKVLKAGLDNSLSSYMNQLSGNVWRRNWFVLTSRTLVCYEDHNQDEAIGVLSLTDYSILAPSLEEVAMQANTFKLTHPNLKSYIFQLPNSYCFERWFGTLQEILHHF